MAWDWDKLQKQKGDSSPGGVDDVVEKIKGAKGKFPGGFWFIIIAIVLIYLGTSCFFTVGVNEVGVVQRFGEYVRTTPPGLNFKLPAGIEKVTKVKTRYVFKEEFGFRTVRADVRTQFTPESAYQDEFLMLTGDLNVAVVPWVVQYRIIDPYKYLFKVRDVRATLRDLAEASMRLVVGDRSIDEVITERQEIANSAEEILQKELDEADTGIKISTIEMKKTNVPEPVRPSFNKVNQAIQKKQNLIYKAKEEYNKVIPEARGNAERTIKNAQGYALERVNRAKGDSARFLALYKEYARAKNVTRRRLYLEAISEVLPKVKNKYIVDEDQENLLPLLKLEKSKGEKQ